MSYMRKGLHLIILILFCNNAYTLSLNIGTISDNPPFESLANENQFFGFDIALMKEICTRIKAQCNFQSALFHQLPQMIQSGSIDLAIAAIIITRERQKNFLFSLPYKESYIQYIALENSNFKSIIQLAGKKLGVYLDSPASQSALEQFSNNIQLKSYDNSMAVFKALQTQEVNAVLTSYTQALYWAANNKNIKLIGKKFLVGDGYGIMTQLGRNKLMRKINKALLAIEADGTYLRLYQDSFQL